MIYSRVIIGKGGDRMSIMQKDLIDFVRESPEECFAKAMEKLREIK
jgi:hypothetical protein